MINVTKWTVRASSAQLAANVKVTLGTEEATGAVLLDVSSGRLSFWPGEKTIGADAAPAPTVMPKHIVLNAMGDVRSLPVSSPTIKIEDL